MKTQLFNKKLKKLSVSLASFVLIVLVFALSAPIQVFAESITDLQQHSQELASEKEAVDKKAESLEADVNEKRNNRDYVNAEIMIVQGEIDELNTQIRELDDKIKIAEAAISTKKRGIDKNLALLKERIKALYVTGEASTIAILLNSKDIMEWSEKAKTLNAITEHDNQLISKLSESLESINDELTEINEDKLVLSDKKKSLDTKCAELGELYEVSQKLLMQAEDAHEAAILNSDLISAEIEVTVSAIAELEEKLKTDSDGNINLNGTGYEGSGDFIWPMPGYTYITCYYGDGGHRGIDVAGGDIYGRPIVASDSGYVEFAGWNDSYGYCVFINHGNGYQTRYAHMSALGIDTGAYVSSGETIGYVGSTGNSTGPHLHFEVILDGNTLNPFNFF